MANKPTNNGNGNKAPQKNVQKRQGPAAKKHRQEEPEDTSVDFAVQEEDEVEEVAPARKATRKAAPKANRTPAPAAAPKRAPPEPQDAYAILPKAQEMFERNKASLNDLAAMLREGVVLICMKPNDQYHYILSHSPAGAYGRPGTHLKVYHKNNPAMKFGGQFEIINEVTFETDKDGTHHFNWKIPNFQLGNNSVSREDFKACLAEFV